MLAALGTTRRKLTGNSVLCLVENFSHWSLSRRTSKIQLHCKVSFGSNMSEWMLQVETSGRPLSWPCGAQRSAAQRTSRMTGAPCRPTQNTTSANGNQSSPHWEESGKKKLNVKTLQSQTAVRFWNLTTHSRACSTQANGVTPIPPATHRLTS